MKCDSCGRSTPDTRSYCRYCGDELDSSSETNRRAEIETTDSGSLSVCPSCGKKTSKSRSYCRNCSDIDSTSNWIGKKNIIGTAGLIVAILSIFVPWARIEQNSIRGEEVLHLGIWGEGGAVGEVTQITVILIVVIVVFRVIRSATNTSSTGVLALISGGIFSLFVYGLDDWASDSSGNYALSSVEVTTEIGYLLFIVAAVLFILHGFITVIR